MGKATHKSHGLGKDELEFLYCNIGLSDLEIGKRFGLSDVGVGYLRKKYGIAAISAEDRVAMKARNGGLKDILKMTVGDLDELYRKFGLSQIGEMFGCSRTMVKRKVDELGIKVLSKHERHEVAYPNSLTQEQVDVLEGSLLGDGMLVRQGTTAKFSECHCLAQKNYLEWKRKVFMPFSYEIKDANKILDDGRSAKGVKFCTCYHSLFLPYETMFYGDNREKKLPLGLMDRISPLSLAVWYMDDGHWNGYEHTLASGFCQTDLDVAVEALNDRFGLNVIRRNGSGISILVFQNKDRFFEIVGKHIQMGMAYKFPLTKRFFLPCVGKPNLSGFDLNGSKARWVEMGDAEREVFLDQCVDYWNVSGFPYPRCSTKDRRAEIKALCNTNVGLGDVVSSGNSVGSSVCQLFFRDFWSAKKNGKKSPLEVFSNRNLLRDAIVDCLEYRGSVTEGNLRSELQTWGGVHNFRPPLAKAIMDKYCPPGGSVLDPCAGWGGRLLGFMCSSNPLRYVGVDASAATVKGLKHMARIVGRDFASKTVEINYGAFEDWKTEDVFDLVFTSPPYFCKELYSQDETQSSVRYGDYESWRDRFLLALVENSLKMLKIGGRLVFNVANVKIGKNEFPIADDIEKMMLKRSVFEARHDLEMKSVYGGESRYEPIFVFRK